MGKGNPQPDLQGFADPEDENWRENAMARLQSRRPKGRIKQLRSRFLSFTLFMDPPFKAMIDEAAKRRNMNTSGYGRRALAAMVAYDLGIPLEEVVYHSAEVREYDQHAGRGAIGGYMPKGATHDDGKGFGPWRITGVKE